MNGVLKYFKSFKDSLPASKYKQGFSITELVIIVAILGIMTTIVLTKFSTVKDRQALESSVADIVTTLNKASSKTLASVNSTTYGVHFESGAVVIFTGTVYPGSLGASGNEPYTRIVSPVSITNVTLHGSSGTSGELYFNRLTGTPSKTGTVTLTSGSFSKTITIGGTGQISSD